MSASGPSGPLVTLSLTQAAVNKWKTLIFGYEKPRFCDIRVRHKQARNTMQYIGEMFGNG